ncbi:AraC family transcriptional regulator [Clostridium folliculivorans]|uniref:AraC family transcriptional regulator n=2 Tax=Clostridium folliculivorans TaxID=2886038 RepID=A0A9W6DA42_9CLOT|nr:AraC family transcriptional regulator [Clostridium folliculivorans]GKU24975.1 AraC family transcriptional regulator [Clostridium folliculivorans]GKU31073.1 AraC family transcriptional regulator [Clostridium folliculivorans]
MDWLEKMNSAISYIEVNLTNNIAYSDVAKIACCSEYHFQRMFSFITDVTLAEYIRRRRLTLAALELQGSSIKVIDVALKYGYESPEAFTRAFKNLHGVSPTFAREKGTQLKAYPSISFSISIKGDVEMNYKIVDKDSFKFFGVEEVMDTTNGNNLVRIPKLWQECFKDGTIERLVKAQPKELVEDGFVTDVNGIMCYREIGEETFPYMIGVFDLDGNAEVPGEFSVISVPALTWVIFRTDEHKSSEVVEKIQAIWERIFSEWFPSSGYEHAEGPELEVYYTAEGDRNYSEVWIPVVKKHA